MKEDITKGDQISGIIQAIASQGFGPDFRCEYKAKPSVPEEISPENRAYTELIAKHLADHYMAGQFGMGNFINMKPMTKADKIAMESAYKAAVRFAVDKFESGLWLEVKYYFGITKPKLSCAKPNWDRVKEILKYKTIGKTKNAVRRFLYT